MTGAGLTEDDVARLRRRGRLLLLLDAAERAAVTPLASARLHAFAYLSDVLSPVWNLPAFDGKILKIDGGPHYPDFQEELDHLVVLGLVEVKDLEYVGRGENGARLEGKYALNFESLFLAPLLAALGAGDEAEAVDPEDRRVHLFMVELAGALATLPNDEIDVAASADVTYRSVPALNNIVDFAEWAEDTWQANPSWQASERFEAFLPDDAGLSPGEKLYLYATYLGRVAHAA
jgi:hypothetical protein